MWNHTGNVLLHKDAVGKSKPTIYNLPEDEFSYGKPNMKGEKGVKYIIHDWQYHKIVPDADCKKRSQKAMMVEANILGKIKKAKELDIKLPEDAFYYGVANKPSTPVKKVINNHFGNVAEKEGLETLLSKRGADLEVSKNAHSKQAAYKPGITRSVIMSKEMNDLRLQDRNIPPQERNKHLFKMKRFNGVQGKVDTNRKPFKPHVNADCEQDIQQETGLAN